METFIVRVWSPARGNPPEPSLRGKVSHVETGRDGAFVGAEELLDFLSSEQESESRTDAQELSGPTASPGG